MSRHLLGISAKSGKWVKPVLVVIAWKEKGCRADRSHFGVVLPQPHGALDHRQSNGAKPCVAIVPDVFNTRVDEDMDKELFLPGLAPLGGHMGFLGHRNMTSERPFAPTSTCDRSRKEGEATLPDGGCKSARDLFDKQAVEDTGEEVRRSIITNTAPRSTVGSGSRVEQVKPRGVKLTRVTERWIQM